MDSELQKQLNALKALHEDDFTSLVVKPLFEAMGYNRVDFNGGPYERGKDLIAQINIPPQRKPTVVYVQSKKIGDILNTKGCSKFTSLLHQLRQCLSGEITTVSGEQLKADRVYLACPELATNRFMEEVKEQVFIKDGQVFEFLDGPRIIEYINQYKPDLIKVLQGEAVFISEKFQTKLTNQLFYDALNFINKNKHELKDIYCESTITIGNEKKRCLLHSTYRIKKLKKLVSVKEFDEYIILNQRILQAAGESLFSVEVLKNISKSYDEFLQLKKDFDFLDNKLTSVRKLIRENIKNSDFNQSYPPIWSEEYKLFIDSSFQDVALTPKDKLTFYQEVREIVELEEQKENFLFKKEELEFKLNLMSEPKSIEFKANEIINLFNKYKEELLSYELIDKVNVASYLKAAKAFEQISMICDYFPDLFENLVTNDSVSSPQLNVLDAFDTPNNIILLGDAGSGKTTNLQIFAKILYEREIKDLVIYATLNEVARYLPNKDSQVFENQILDSLLNYLKFEIDPSVNEFSLREHLAKSGTVLIFDSIDEAIVEFPWIIKSLRELSSIYKNIRVITSSRFSVDNISGLGFVSISLSPFKDEQKRSFFNKWFIDEKEKAVSIMEHLNNNTALDKIVTNPLSATIMATLQASDVPLPKNETALYKKRFELLSGVFDRYKGSKRQLSDCNELIDCARILAYLMHSANKREWPLDTIIEKLGYYYEDKSKLELLVNELQNPSEILLVNLNGKLGFGHLRFQEYLCSEHIDKQQNHRIETKLKSSWWHDVLILYSQHAFQIEWVINDAAVGGYTRRVRKILKEMVANRPYNEAKTLYSRIEIAAKDESLYD